MTELTQAPLQDLIFRLEGGDALDVRTFKVDDRIGHPFVIELTATTPNADLDLESFIGENARFDIAGRRSWSGVVRDFQQLRAEIAKKERELKAQQIDNALFSKGDKERQQDKQAVDFEKKRRGMLTGPYAPPSKKGHGQE